MKRSVYLWLILGVVAFALIGGAAALAAQGNAPLPQTTMGQGMMGQGMMGGGMMGRGMMGMGGGASGSMMGAQGPMSGSMMGGCPMGGGMGGAALTVSSDGVYVLAGTTLLKYDKNLKPIGETEIRPEAWARTTAGATKSAYVPDH